MKSNNTNSSNNFEKLKQEFNYYCNEVDQSGHSRLSKLLAVINSDKDKNKTLEHLNCFLNHLQNPKAESQKLSKLKTEELKEISTSISYLSRTPKEQRDKDNLNILLPTLNIYKNLVDKIAKEKVEYKEKLSRAYKLVRSTFRSFGGPMGFEVSEETTNQHLD